MWINLSIFPTREVTCFLCSWNFGPCVNPRPLCLIPVILWNAITATKYPLDSIFLITENVIAIYLSSSVSDIFQAKIHFKITNKSWALFWTNQWWHHDAGVTLQSTIHILQWEKIVMILSSNEQVHFVLILRKESLITIWLKLWSNKIRHHYLTYIMKYVHIAYI